MSIELKSINKIYKKGKYALKDINFKFEETGFYSLVGRSGSGKSTLLNVLTLLDYPTDGLEKKLILIIKQKPILLETVILVLFMRMIIYLKIIRQPTT